MDDSPPVSPKLVRQSVSPATSTPDQHQAIHPVNCTETTDASSPAKVRHSELSESDESAIMNSYTEDDSTVLYEKPEDDTTILEKSPDESCVADRTRAKSSLSGPNSTVAFNLSNLMEMIKRESE